MFCLGECSSICLRLPRAGWSRTELRSDCLRNHYARGGEDGHPTIHLLAKGQLAWVFLRALISSPKLGCPVVSLPSFDTNAELVREARLSGSGHWSRSLVSIFPGPVEECEKSTVARPVTPTKRRGAALAPPCGGIRTTGAAVLLVPAAVVAGSG